MEAKWYPDWLNTAVKGGAWIQKPNGRASALEANRFAFKLPFYYKIFGNFLVFSEPQFSL